MIFQETDSELFGDDHVQGHHPKKDHARKTSSSNPAAGQGKMPVTAERMDAIRNMKTMAGSPDADLVLRSASRNLAHGLCVFGLRALVNP
jgi:hypothetical protein